MEKGKLGRKRMGQIRLNKFLAQSGVCSRREADRLIAEGRVTVDGRTAQVGMSVSEEQEVRVGKKIVQAQEQPVFLAVNKPVGIVCTEEKRERDSIIRFLNYPVRITYIGRLDKDSEGLLLMTNQGDVINKMMRSGNRHEKEYEVTVDKPVTDAFCRAMAGGVHILDTITRSCTVEKTGKYKFRIILTQGLNRQIRRMCEALGYHVAALKRVRIMNIELGDLQTGAYRELTEEELAELFARIRNSSNAPVMDEKAVCEQREIHRRLSKLQKSDKKKEKQRSGNRW